MPTWTAWAASMNIYLSPPGGAPGVSLLYMTIPRSQYGYGNTYPIGAAIPLSAALSGTAAAPPTTNLAAANTPKLPILACYEGGATTPVPPDVPLVLQLGHDSFAHPSGRDLSYGWYVACQQGNPTVVGGGSGLSVYYQMYDGFTYGNMWVMAYGTSQPPGDGVSYAYGGRISSRGRRTSSRPSRAACRPTGTTTTSTTRHRLLQGWRDWFNAVGPIQPTPTPPPRTRRWFAGLRRPVMRLGR